MGQRFSVAAVSDCRNLTAIDRRIPASIDRHNPAVRDRRYSGQDLSESDAVGRKGELGLEGFEARHPGLRRQVDAMFEAFVPTREVAAAIRAQFGGRISDTTIWLYKRNYWNRRRDQVLARKAVECALRELASEKRN